ncbi:MAG: hypothetical protein COZ18_15375 [Flexibacter sp. CG_4_10_14_3_um_filter_32_15]|nr:MAG: hypothetical protein COZ18_15375 [Flexibacter sp. CG_4_10_14_3_um_filter_32_15]
MKTSIEALYANIQSYKRKYYKNLLLKGSLLAISAFLGAFAIVSILEYFGNFSSTFRAVLFYSFISVSIFSLVYWVIIPIYQLFTLDKQLPHNEAARQIGRYFPQVQDRLLNVLQLHSTNSNAQSSDLYQASIEQKASQFAPISFADAIKYEQNRRYLRFLFIPIVLIGAFLVWDLDFYKASAVRLVNYEQDFAPKAPFEFSVDTKQLIAFKGEDLNFDVNLSGSAFPNEVFLITENGRKIKLDKNSASSYSYQFTNIQRPFEFSLDGEGYTSKMYEIIVRQRPQLRNFVAYLNYPNYTGKKDERLENTGNLIVPAGTQIEWRFQTQETEKLNFVSIISEDSTNVKKAKKEEDGFLLQTTALKSEAFEIELENKYSKNKEKISYLLTVIQDESPKVSLNQFQDSVMYDYLMLGGNISDDYGITNLRFNYRITSNKKTSEYKSLPLKFNPNAINQQYFHQVELEPLNLQAGDELEYFVQVWDNDGVRGRKSSKTGSYRFKIPKELEMRESVSETSKSAESQIDKTLEEAQDLNKKLKQLAEDLKGKKNLNWQQQKELEKLLEQKKQLEDDIKKMQEQNKKLNEQQEKFTEQDERIAEKSKKLQELMDELMDEKTKELYDKLQELLQEQSNSEEIKEVLEKLQNKEMNLEKELDRTLEMFKKLEVDKKMQDIAKQLEELGKEQKDLAKETEKQQKKEEADRRLSEKDKEETDRRLSEKDKEEADRRLSEEQKELNEKFEEMKEQLEELDKMNEELKTPKDLEDTKKKEEEVTKDQEQSSEQLEQKEKKKAAQSQENAGEKMEEMAKQMQQMTSSAEMEQAQEDYDDLRQLLENLLKLSFEQEEIMNGFNEIDQRDPKYITLSQKQLKLKDDAQIVEDSLRALAKRVFQIESFVMRELTDMNDYMEQVTQEVKDRKNPRMLASRQQSVMTSINNLALMLNDVLEQMQQSMSQMGMGKPKPSNQSGSPSPSMSEMQQSINQQIENLKKSGKSGRQLSEGLAKIAAQQEALRRALQKAMQQGKGKEGKGKDGKEGKEGGQKGQNGMQDGEGEGGENGNQDGGSGGNGGNMSKMIKDMEKTEEDLVNKRLTQELIERQKQIMTRLLQSEKAERERDLDEKREAEQAKANKRRVPPQFEEYFKQKEQQIELLKTIPPALSPYYKQQVNEYFKKLEE